MNCPDDSLELPLEEGILQKTPGQDATQMRKFEGDDSEAPTPVAESWHTWKRMEESDNPYTQKILHLD